MQRNKTATWDLEKSGHSSIRLCRRNLSVWKHCNLTPGAHNFALCQFQTASDATTQLLLFWSFSILFVHVQLFSAFHSLQIFAPGIS